MHKLIEKVALIKSIETNLINDARRCTNKKGRELQKDIWGTRSFQTAESWLKNSRPRFPTPSGSDTTCASLCTRYNRFIAEYFSDKPQYQPLSVEDFEESMKRFDFAKKIGCEINRWDVTQQHIDKVLLDHNITDGHFSNTKTEAGEVLKLFSGFNLCYMKSLTASREDPVLLRFVLRVKRHVVHKKLFYVPCKAYIPIPSRRSVNEYVEYDGWASYRNNQTYFTLSNFDHVSETKSKQNIGDHASLVIDHTNPWKSRVFQGLYSSISVSKQPYASAAIVIKRESTLNFPDPYKVRPFIEENMSVFPKGVEQLDAIFNMQHLTDEDSTSTDDNYTKSFLDYLDKTLKSSPFTPFLNEN